MHQTMSSTCHVFHSLSGIVPDCRLPQFHRTTRKLKVAVDFYQQRMLKFDGIAEFHTRFELYYAVLLEIDPSVKRYVPQPCHFRMGATRYPPDFFVERNQGCELVELKCDSELNEQGEWTSIKAKKMSAYCQAHHMGYRVIANSSLESRIPLCLHWLPILRMLAQHQEIASDSEEIRVLRLLSQLKSAPFSTLIDANDREASLQTELAVYRLVLEGKLQLDLSTARLHADSQVVIL